MIQTTSQSNNYAPETWQIITIGDITEKFLNGGTPSTKNPEYWQGNIPWTTSSPMTSFYLDHGESTISKEGLEKSASNLIPKNNVLIATRVDIGKVSMNRIDVAINQDLTGLILDKSKITPEFFVWVMLSDKYNQKLKGMSRGTTIKGVIRSELERFSIPLPPLPEQRRIATILTTVDDAIQRSQQAVAETERLKAGVMQELMTKGIGHTEFREDPDIGMLPKEWDITTIRQVTEKFLNGGTPSTKNPEYWEGKIQWTTSSPMTSFYLDRGETTISREGLEKSASNLIPKNNVLLATRVGIGKVVMNRIDIAINQDLTGLLLDKTKIIPEFFVWLLLSDKYNHKLKGMSRGTTIKGLIREEVERVAIPLPVISEQQRIVTILSTIDQRLDLQRQRTAHYERLKQGLMNDLLTGRRRVKVT